MSLVNPFTNPPRLPSPTKRRVHSRSASRSPVRQHAADFDPLLRDLSPTTTLRTFKTEPDEARDRELASWDLEASSTSERALGAKAAQACLDLRAWTRELEAWEWPGTFDVPEAARKKIRLSNMTWNTIATTDVDNEDEEVQYWGSLPAPTVQAYGKRVHEIGACLDEIDVEELKSYVLVSHYRADSRPSSRGDSINNGSTTSDLKRLDDFTALVTATILQALPYLSRLHRLLDTWAIRLSILRNAPTFLRDLKRARTDLDHGWAAIAVSSISGSDADHARFGRTTMNEMRSMIEQQISHLGRCLDRFLDDLEAREDTVPDSWVDDFELLESAYGTWVVQAERRVLENEWRVDAGGLKARQAASLNARPGEHVDCSELRTGSHDGRAQTRETHSIDEAIRAFHGSADTPKPNISEPLGNNTVLTTNHATSTTILSSSADIATSSGESASSNVGLQEEGLSQIAKRRAAFLNDIERTNSLKQSKSPVRPFEHASNAFTRLFKKDRSPEQKRIQKASSSNGSRAGSVDGMSNSTDRESSWPASEPKPRVSSKRVESPALVANDSPRSIDARQKRGTAAPRTETAAARPDSGTHSAGAIASSTHGTRDSLQNETIENWPLASSADILFEPQQTTRGSEEATQETSQNQGSGPELEFPADPIETDTFDRMFVESLPSRPTTSPGPAPSLEPPPSWPGSRRRTASLPRSKRANFASYLDMVGAGTSRAASNPAGRMQVGRSRSTSLAGAPRFDLRDAPALPQMSALPHQKTRASLDRSHAQTEHEQTKSASPASNVSQSADPSQHPQELEAREVNVDERDEFDLTKAVNEDNPQELEGREVNVDENEDFDSTKAVKRASVTSIGAFQRSEVRSIDIGKTSRQSSSASRKTPPPQSPGRLPGRSSAESSRDESEGSPMTYKGMVAFPTPPPRKSNVSTPNSGRTTPTVLQGIGDSSPLRPDLNESPLAASKAPLNDIMAKRRSKRRSGRIDENEKPPTPAITQLSSVKSSALTSQGDSFDRHVSEVLETLPGQITFKTRPGAETPVPRAAGYIGPPRPKQSALHVPPRTGSMTIAPAEHSSQKSSSAADQEVKLYHLTQAGREEPIKLFVRLVGEGERVMVRVGGGWADLAEYLRQYAEHHGSRTVSEGAVEVQTMPNVQSRRVSGPAERAKTPISPAVGSARPGSSDSDKEYVGRPPPSNRTVNGRSTPTREKINGRSTPTTDKTTTGRHTPTGALGSTPQSTSTGSRPSTANLSRPSSRQQNTTSETVGLSGPPSGKKNGLSEHKAKWVEGMIERAKQASSEKNKEEHERYFGELGKAGGTRRVIFRSGSSGAGTSERVK